jgi:hypothetical protein
MLREVGVENWRRSQREAVRPQRYGTVGRREDPTASAVVERVYHLARWKYGVGHVDRSCLETVALLSFPG